MTELFREAKPLLSRFKAAYDRQLELGARELAEDRRMLARAEQMKLETDEVANAIRDEYEKESQPMRQRLAEMRAKQAEADAVLAGRAGKLAGVRAQLAQAQAKQDQMSEIYEDLVNNMKHNEQKLDAQYKEWNVKGAHVMMYKEKMEDQRSEVRQSQRGPSAIPRCYSRPLYGFSA